MKYSNSIFSFLILLNISMTIPVLLGRIGSVFITLFGSIIITLKLSLKINKSNKPCQNQNI